ncbi:hypothetical protein ACFQZX_06545 [Mucilaginibacter litoreus]|uniref:Aerotolerance regulator N-terminal domain-containing protein n=1 Tax=Mucilaginibacter litoreus TaxID=1048221 RepID=A0ABW3AQN3_9SPHI
MQAGWTYIVIVTCVIIAAIFIWLEIKRANKSRLIWRVMAVILAVAALACIALPLKFSRVLNIDTDKKAILLTQGFDPDSIKVQIGTGIFTLNKAIKKEYSKAHLISSIGNIPPGAALHVYGYGLSYHELEQLKESPISFHPSSEPSGIAHASWPESLKAGDALTVQGIYNNTSAQKVKLVLKGLATPLDSVVIPAQSRQSFKLSAIPKSTGKLIYQLYADTALQGSIPLQVIPAKPLNVLILSASPDFETKFLKNWLGTNGYGVAQRTAISKNKFNTEYINLQKTAISSLSSASLSKFDVLIGDLSVLSNLSDAEAAALKQQVTDAGLGLIVRADSTGKKTWLQSEFTVENIQGKEPAPSAIIIGGDQSKSAKLTTGSAYLVEREGVQTLLKANNRILAATAIAGYGKLIFTTLNNTYSWMLAGNEKDYASVWTTMLNAASKKKTDVQSELSFNNLPVVKSPVQIQYRQNTVLPIKINDEQFAPAQNPAIPFQWSVNYEPKQYGWQTLKTGDQILNWYAYPQQEWKAVQALERIASTKKYAASHPLHSIVTKQIHQKVLIDVPKIYFYILLLAACTFLWVETKFS